MVKKKLSKKGVLKVIAGVIILLAIFNQLGNRYLCYDMKSDKLIVKANLLKYFFKKNYQIKGGYLQVRNNVQELVRQWKIKENDSIKVYYKIINKEIEALGDYEYYILNKQNNSTSLLKIDMQVSPDSTSHINFLTLQNNELISKKGKIKLKVLMDYNECGLSIFQTLITGKFEKSIIVEDQEQIRILTDNEVKDFVNF